MNSGYEQNQPGLLFFMISEHNMNSNIINLYNNRLYTQRAFYRVQELSKRSSDEEIMTVQSWRLPMNTGYEQHQQGLLFFMIYEPNMSSNISQIYINGL